MAARNQWKHLEFGSLKTFILSVKLENIRIGNSLNLVYRLDVSIFCKMHHRIQSVLCLSVRQFQMPYGGRVTFRENGGNTKMVCLR